MADHITEAKGAIVAALKADATVTALVPATRIYNVEAPATPVWPWILVGPPTETSDNRSCTDGSLLSVVVHGFAKGPGELAMAGIANAVKRALDGKTYSRLAGTVAVDVQFSQTQIIRDSAEASAYHSISRFEVAVAEYA